MSMRSVFLILAIGIVTFIVSCKDNSEASIDQVPSVPVNVTVNVSLPQYINLQTIGNFAYTDGGYKGIYLFHNYNDEYVAFDRCCTYKPFDSCAKVSVDTAQLLLKCACCQSQFQMDGSLRTGPASRSLKQYNIYRSGDLLNITN